MWFVPPNRAGFIPHRCIGCWVFVIFGDDEAERRVSRYHERLWLMNSIAMRSPGSHVDCRTT